MRGTEPARRGKATGGGGLRVVPWAMYKMKISVTQTHIPIELFRLNIYIDNTNLEKIFCLAMYIRWNKTAEQENTGGIQK